MTAEKVIRAATLRGMFFNGRKEWQNSFIGYGYSMYTIGGGFLQADTLTGLYKMIMKYPKIKIN